MVSANCLFFFFAQILVQGISAAPTQGTVVPKIIPGPGLPSLESLNLTSAELFALPSPFSEDQMNTLVDGSCGPNDSAYTHVNLAIACYHFVRNLGSQRCEVPASGHAIYCLSESGDGKAHLTGRSLTGRVEASSCADTAAGALWTIDHCTRPGGSTAGLAPPNGNGNILVGTSNRNFWG
ncbi:hypothetical protein B0J11DRAFT_608287 [Dendryphion nanum]|uniref:Uncharacterized protein n=1 Tax=Dendryphion nanum TaxID=256645 RepID=A0A9P9DPJ7_9PLEO|nr:hypothetical protein B0J11DRAFT_608287 [Dendryphion nanum]